VKKIERADAQCEQRQTFQEFVGGDEAQAAVMGYLFGHFSGHDCISRSRLTPAACGEPSAIVFSLDGESDFAARGRE